MLMVLHLQIQAQGHSLVNFNSCTNVKAGVIFLFLGKLKDLPINNADDPEFTYKHSAFFEYFSISRSNFLE